MPIHEFKCAESHVSEQLFLTFSAVTETIKCKTCGKVAKKVEFSKPLEAMFYGEGFYKPSPTKRKTYRGGDSP